MDHVGRLAVSCSESQEGTATEIWILILLRQMSYFPEQRENFTSDLLAFSLINENTVEKILETRITEVGGLSRRGEGVSFSYT